ncbi:hypothetical protein LA080_004347 [Diaporthe eres]|nr:hypothetical protein LA080_004347 [Diaporthe eres]
MLHPRLKFGSSSAAEGSLSAKSPAKFAKSVAPSQEILGFHLRWVARRWKSSNPSNSCHGADPREMIGSVGDLASTFPPPPLGVAVAHRARQDPQTRRCGRAWACLRILT